MTNIIVWKFQLQIITYFEWPEKLDMIAHSYHFEYRIRTQHFSYQMAS